MIFLISGASHTGKTLLAQRLMEEIRCPYWSLDLLKMGLIRSRQTTLTPLDDAELTEYLWPIVCQLIQTAIENQQHLIVEGCYIPFNWADSFAESYRRQIHCCFLAMRQQYLQNHFAAVMQYANVIEQRLDDSDFSLAQAQRENARFLEGCRAHGCRCFLVEHYVPDTTAILETLIKEWNDG